jgi:GNAT superfamily N-acetyltransferase
MIQTTPLERQRHKRRGFDCGIEALNHYLKNFAAQQADRNIARTYVLESQERGGEIIGFYTLSMIAVELDGVPKKIRKKYPHYNVAGLLGRLAVDRKYQRKGWGEWLLVDALKRLLHAAGEIGFPMVVVDAKEGKEGFYRHYGFQPFSGRKGRLFMTVADLRASVGD